MNEQNPRTSAIGNEADYDEILRVYANNVRFDMNAWDLRLVFGQLMPSGVTRGESVVDWHTDVTIPWAQAKLMHLYLGINLALYEAENGPIKLPPRVIPPTRESSLG